MSDNIASQHSPGCPEDEPSKPKFNNQAELSKTGRKNGGRADRGRIHVSGSSVLSRGLMETLVRYGENLRTLRRVEAECRASLRPSGSLGKLFFDRFWTCVLRLILVGHLEKAGLAPGRNNPNKQLEAPSLREGLMPILLTGEECEDSAPHMGTFDALEPDLFQRRALIARYDQSASREMFRCLSILLLMRDEGEKGLSNAIRAAARIKGFQGEE